MAAFEEQAQRNMQLFQQALSMWKPFAAGMTGTPMGMPQPPRAAAENDDAKEAQVSELRRQMEAMQKQLDAMSRKP
jgi:polyhydroxyalkanoate synthesis regulator protein